MKWKNKEDLKRRVGEKRIMSKFFLWPRSFGDHFYWLCRRNVVEKLTKIDGVGGGGWDTGYTVWKWKEIGLS
ncbi:hypothetical protein KAR91_01200 [Candidatus Pacearchaeota archaeon]|nr:hypothetical protein [Candidatus Pacearchaeota archaeon]